MNEELEFDNDEIIEIQDDDYLNDSGVIGGFEDYCEEEMSIEALQVEVDGLRAANETLSDAIKLIYSTNGEDESISKICSNALKSAGV